MKKSLVLLDYLLHQFTNMLSRPIHMLTYDGAIVIFLRTNHKISCATLANLIEKLRHSSHRHTHRGIIFFHAAILLIYPKTLPVNIHIELQTLSDQRRSAEGMDE